MSANRHAQIWHLWQLLRYDTVLCRAIEVGRQGGGGCCYVNRHKTVSLCLRQLSLIKHSRATAYFHFPYNYAQLTCKARYVYTIRLQYCMVVYRVSVLATGRMRGYSIWRHTKIWSWSWNASRQINTIQLPHFICDTNRLAKSFVITMKFIFLQRWTIEY